MTRVRQGTGDVELDGYGNVVRVPVPREPAHEVYPGLWIGGGAWDQTETFDTVLTCARPWEVGPVPARIESARFSFDDGRDIPDGLDKAGLWVAAHVRAGEKVLVRCYAGLNRSGLVVATALHELTGLPGSKVILAMRAVRSPHVLCNPAFAAHIEAIPADPSRRDT